MNSLERRQCPSCKLTLSSASKFCPRCGEALVTAKPPEASAAPPPPDESGMPPVVPPDANPFPKHEPILVEPTATPPKPRRGGPSMWLILVFLVIAVGIFAAVYFQGPAKAPSLAAPDSTAPVPRVTFGRAPASATNDLSGRWTWPDIEGDHEAVWNLHQTGDKLRGDYQWDGRGDIWPVEGQISPTGTIVLRDVSDRIGHANARFEGSLQPNGSIRGYQYFPGQRNEWVL